MTHLADMAILVCYSGFVRSSAMALTKTKASDVARYLILLASAEAEPEYLSPMRLQKLLYYVQGWHLARTGLPMFSDRIEAWARGPVVPSVWREYRDKGTRIIFPEGLANPNLSDADKKFVESVWSAYKGFSAISLSEMTHGETPWKETRGNLPPEASCKRVIDTDRMKRFFEACDKGA